MKTKTVKPPVLDVELLQSHFPYSQGGIKLELERAIRECEVFQTGERKKVWEKRK